MCIYASVLISCSFLFAVEHTQTGTINMLGLAKRVKARILLASTSEIYGDPEVHPQPEVSSLFDPHFVYCSAY